MHRFAKPRCDGGLDEIEGFDGGASHRVYLTNGLAESGDNLEKMWKLADLVRSCELPYICMGDWVVTLEKLQKTYSISAIGAVVKKPVGVEYTCSSGNRLLDWSIACWQMWSR